VRAARPEVDERPAEVVWPQFVKPKVDFLRKTYSAICEETQIRLNIVTPASVVKFANRQARVFKAFAARQR
jgi:hypothetical protein